MVPLEFQDSSQKLDPTTMPADTVGVELEIGPSVMLLYGSLLRNFMHLKVHFIWHWPYFLCWKEQGFILYFFCRRIYLERTRYLLIWRKVKAQPQVHLSPCLGLLWVLLLVATQCHRLAPLRLRSPMFRFGNMPTVESTGPCKSLFLSLCMIFKLILSRLDILCITNLWLEIQPNVLL